jgi:hypothetical protein
MRATPTCVKSDAHITRRAREPPTGGLFIFLRSALAEIALRTAIDGHREDIPDLVRWGSGLNCRGDPLTSKI